MALEQSLIVLESDKATMDVPSPQAGQVKKLLVKEGDKVSEGSPILEIEKTADAAEESAASDKQDDAAQPEEKDESPDGVEKDSEAVDKPDSQAESSTTRGQAVEEDVLVPDIGGADAVEVIERQFNLCLVGNGEKVKNRIG